jgi:hypothetical protein
MRRREWFKRWRDDEGYSGKHVVSIDPRVSGTPGFLKVLWSKRPLKEQREDANQSIVKRADPLSHGLF